MSEQRIVKTVQSSFMAHKLCCRMQNVMVKPVDTRIYGGFDPYAILKGADGSTVVINIKHSMRSQ